MCLVWLVLPAASVEHKQMKIYILLSKAITAIRYLTTGNCSRLCPEITCSIAQASHYVYCSGDSGVNTEVILKSTE